MLAGSSRDKDLFRQHVEDGSFVFGLWERSLIVGVSPLVHFVDGVDERLVAHVEAVSGASSSALLEAFAEASADGGDATTVALIALAMSVSKDPALAQMLVDAVKASEPSHVLIGRALGLSWRRLDRLLIAGLAGASDGVTASLLNILALRRHPMSVELDAYLRSADLDIRAAALRCAAFSPQSFAHLIEPNFGAESAELREAALEAALGQRLQSAAFAARWMVQNGFKGSELALMVLAIGAHPEDLCHLEAAAAATSTTEREAVWALGCSGWARAADVLLELTARASVADLAVDGFETISDVRVERAALSVQDEAEDEVVEEVPLSKPWNRRWLCPPVTTPMVVDSTSAKASWHARRATLGAAPPRLLRGKPMSGSTLLHALWREPLRRRHARALELALRSSNAVRINSWSWGWQQARSLAAAPPCESILASTPLSLSGLVPSA